MHLLLQRKNMSKWINALPSQVTEYNAAVHRPTVFQILHELVSNESKFVKLEYNLEMVDKLAASGKHATELFERIVHHFKDLFDVKRIEGGALPQYSCF